MKFDVRQRASLVIAHPGHELRVYGWLETVRPVVFVLTDGSGRSGISRLDRTATIISQVGASRGGIFGRFTDAAVYAAILEGDFNLFHRLVDELSLSFSMHDIAYVAGDASEGYNPAHDLCRLILNTAVSACRLRWNRQIANFDFPLTGRPDEGDPARLSRALGIELDEAGFQRKIQAARSYSELRSEIEAATKQNGLSSFRKEYLRPVCRSRPGYVFTEPPFYERYGEKQVAAGAYPRVLRYREHMLPIADALERHAKRKIPACLGES
jgi:hypothetical protein